MKFSVIVALEKNNGIAKNGDIPWKNGNFGKIDLEYFARVTKGNNMGMNAVIMGHKTWKTLPSGGLKDRHNIVLSRNTCLTDLEHAYVMHDFDEALRFCKSKSFHEVWVIGGSEIYTIAMEHPLLDKLYLTYIPEDHQCDQFFPCERISSMTEITPVYSSPLRHIFECSNKEEFQYLRLLEALMNAPLSGNRTKIQTRKLFAQTLRFNLYSREGMVLPLLTTRRISYKLILTELLWFLSGNCTNTKYLVQHNNHIWDGNTSREFLDSRGLTEAKGYNPGDTGKIYGFQWRHWNGAPGKEGIDQLNAVIKMLKTNPDDRRMIVSAWNPEQLDEMALPPCHWSFQFTTTKEAERYVLNCLVNMRSGDMALGVPFNIASYATLVHIIAKIVGMIPGELVIMIADCHIYNNHVDGIKSQIERNPFLFPRLTFGPMLDSIKDPSIEDFVNADLDQYIVENYNAHNVIRYEMNV
jgi:dihydrofolate reductase/thymidylate synthase